MSNWWKRHSLLEYTGWIVQNLHAGHDWICTPPRGAKSPPEGNLLSDGGDLKNFQKYSIRFYKGDSPAIISMFSATLCLAQPKQVNAWLKRILGNLTIHFDQVLSYKIFLILSLKLIRVLRYCQIKVQKWWNSTFHQWWSLTHLNMTISQKSI